MKKNIMMRAASALLVAVLLTTSAISGTFAKYVTESTSTDTARVAKWGVEIVATGSMFSKNYYGDDNGNGIALGTTTFVDSSNDEKILAPGTKGELTKVVITGSPEVKVEVSYTGTVDLGDNWKAKFSESGDESYYCPLKITVGSDILNGLDYETADAFETAIKGKIEAYKKTYSANTNLSYANNENLAISWEWPFKTTGPSTGSTRATKSETEYNYADTYLGDWANRATTPTTPATPTAEGGATGGTSTSKAPTITISVTTTVTQVD